MTDLEKRLAEIERKITLAQELALDLHRSTRITARFVEKTHELQALLEQASYELLQVQGEK